MSAGMTGHWKEGKFIKAGQFTKDEDKQILDLVGKTSIPQWNDIAAKIWGRSARQVRDRYLNYLSPELNKEPWTVEEDELLREKFAQHGSHWSFMKPFFVKRTCISLKNRWLMLSRRDDQRLARHEADFGQQRQQHSVIDELDFGGLFRREMATQTYTQTEQETQTEQRAQEEQTEISRI
jgi:hypothetical protein